MSTELYYSVANDDQPSPNTVMSFQDRASLLARSHDRHSPSHQGFGPGGINMYHQQQIQAALYQQQQIEFAQQQAQLEMHLQLEQMRLQNLALQEQIMMGQVHAQQQAQAQAEHQLRNTLYASSKPLGSNRPNFTQTQGGLLAERALARRQQAEADALYAQYYPAIEDPVADMDGGLDHLGGPEDHCPGSQSPPTLVVSEPDEVFPVFAPAQPSLVKISSPMPKLTTRAHKHTDSGSSTSSAQDSSSHAPLPTDSQGSLGSLTDSEPVTPLPKSTPMVVLGKKFSEVVKSSPPSLNKSAPAPSISVNTVAPKLNPCSSVFVPGSASGSDQEQVNSSVLSTHSVSQALASPPLTEASQRSASSPTPPSSNVYRAPRSKTPPTGKSAPARNISAPVNGLIQPLLGAMPTRQPRGPAAEAELTNQNFATRIRKRAIGAIKTLGPRPPTSPGPVSTPTLANYQYHHQQQHLLEVLMVQQQQQQALAAAGFLDVDLGFHPSMVSPSGIAHLMATARAREERFGY